MMHESLEELGAALPLIQKQKDGFSFRERIYPLNREAEKYSGTVYAEWDSLSQLLYAEIYARKKSEGKKSLHMPETGPQYKEQEAAFMQELSQANTTRERNDRGWTIYAVYPGGQLSVGKAGLYQVVQPGEYELEGATEPQVQGMLSRRYLKENKYIQQAFYYMYSESGFDYGPTSLRIYWNLEARGAAPLVKSISQVLNRHRLPFLFKCLNHPALYGRRDAAVLYVQKRYASLLAALLPEIISQVTAFLQEDVPLFSCRLEKGVGFAESPVNGDSFGMSRMRLVASALVQAFAQKELKQEQYLGNITQVFSQNGVDPARPYMNEGNESSFATLYYRNKKQ